MIRAFRGISFTLSLLAPLLAENNIQNYPTSAKNSVL